MPRLFESSIEALIPNPIYLLLAILALATISFYRGWPRSFKLLLIALAGWSYVLTTPAITRVLVDRLESAFPPVAPKGLARGPDIVVLASGSMEIYKGKDVPRLDRPAWERIHAAAELWRQNNEGRLIILGGPRIQNVSPSTEMASIAVELGVPRPSIIVDDRAETTREGFAQLKPPTIELSARSWLVTSAIHMPRSILAAREYGLDLQPFPCDFIGTDIPGWYQWVPSTLAYRLNVEVLHEYIGIFAYKGYFTFLSH